MKEDIIKRLEAEEQDEELAKLAEKVRSNVKRSRSKMSLKYSAWDTNNDVYTGVRSADEADLKAREDNEPEKLVVPMAFAQIQTFVAFCFLLFKQNGKVFELMSSGAEDGGNKDVGEKLLEQNMRHNQFDSQLYAFLLNIARFNIGVMKSCWVKESQWVEVPSQPVMQVADGGYDQMTPTSMIAEEVTSYEGNLIKQVSPYNFFPDPNYSIADWRKGSFVADESEYHIGALKQRERKGEVYGIDHVEPMDRAEWSARGTTRLDGMSAAMNKAGDDKDDQMVCVTECQMELVPEKYGLGPQTYPMKYVVEVANDSRVIRVEPLGYLHGQWTYDVGQFSPDQHQLIGSCLSDTIGALQDVVSFLFNSRLMSVRRSLDNNMVIDPSGIDMTSVESRSPWIIMKKGSPRLGVEKFIKQLNYVDATSTHLNDADTVMRIMQAVTGVNENAMGQFSGGRRSATEARAVNAGGASRLKMTAQLIFSDALAPAGSKMLSNLRQGISQEFFVKVVGEDNALKYETFKPADQRSLVGAQDFFVFDATLQSEKGFIAQSLQELVSALTSNPVVMQLLPLDVGKLIEEIMTLRGITDLERFRIQQQPINEQQQLLGPPVPGQELNGPPQLAQGGAGLPPVGAY